MKERWWQKFEWYELINYGVHCVIFGIPLRIQRKRLLNKMCLSYLVKKEMDQYGKCVEVEMRVPRYIWDAPFVYTFDVEGHLIKTLRASIYKGSVDKIKIRWATGKEFMDEASKKLEEAE